MILVILGTQNLPFNRLIDAIQNQIDQGKINDKVIVQAGCTTINSDDMEVFDLIPVNEFDKLIKDADLIISHAGVGSILGGLINNKKVIAAARDVNYGEHVNNHQYEILEQFEKQGYILGLYDFEKLDDVLQKSRFFKPKKYISNTDFFVSKIDEYISES